MNLTKELADLTAQSKAQATPESLAATEETKEAIRRLGLAEKAIREGGKLPEFSLQDGEGRTVRSADLLSRGPLVVAFFRGGWCPYCNLELNALRLALPEIHALGGSLVAISPELPGELAKTADRFALNFLLLSDHGNALARTMGLVYRLPESMQAEFRKHGILLPEINGDDSWELPLPATYLVGPDGTILEAFVEADYYLRKDPQELLREFGERLA